MAYQLPLKGSWLCKGNRKPWAPILQPKKILSDVLKAGDEINKLPFEPVSIKYGLERITLTGRCVLPPWLVRLGAKRTNTVSVSSQQEFRKGGKK